MNAILEDARHGLALHEPTSKKQQNQVVASVFALPPDAILPVLGKNESSKQPHRYLRVDGYASEIHYKPFGRQEAPDHENRHFQGV